MKNWLPAKWALDMKTVSVRPSYFILFVMIYTTTNPEPNDRQANHSQCFRGLRLFDRDGRHHALRLCGHPHLPHLHGATKLSLLPPPETSRQFWRSRTIDICLPHLISAFVKRSGRPSGRHALLESTTATGNNRGLGELPSAAGDHAKQSRYPHAAIFTEALLEMFAV